MVLLLGGWTGFPVSYPFVPKNSTRKFLKSSPEGQSCSPGPGVEYSVDSMPDQGSLGKHQPRPCGHIGDEVMSQGQDNEGEPQENVCPKALTSLEDQGPGQGSDPCWSRWDQHQAYCWKHSFHHRMPTGSPQGSTSLPSTQGRPEYFAAVLPSSNACWGSISELLCWGDLLLGEAMPFFLRWLDSPSIAIKELFK